MSRLRLRPFFILLLCAAVVISLALNVVLIRQSIQDYRDLNDARLDPLGLQVFADGTDNSQTASRISNTVVFFGDSRAQDWPNPTGAGEFTFINRGIGSQTSAQALGRFDQHARILQPRIIIVQIGINDLKTIPLFPERKARIIEECERNIGQIVSRSTSDGATVILTTIFPAGIVPLERMLFWSPDVSIAVNEVNGYIRTLESPKVIILDAYSILAANGVTQSQYAKDTLHVNAAGYAALNVELKKVLLRLR